MMKSSMLSLRTRMLVVAGVVLALLLALLVPARMVAAQSTDAGARPMTVWERKVLESEGMASAHPDFRWRRAALVAIAKDQQRLAQTYLERAAKYADKPSQALIAERYWQGDGVPRDRALGYAWMDLAAERGYVMFTAHREKYWAAMDESERARALQVGQAVYAEYGDDVAKPRLETQLLMGLRRKTGTRTGAHNVSQVYAAPAYNASGGQGIRKRNTGAAFIVYVGNLLPEYYAPRFWEPKSYWEWQDEMHTELPLGIVNIGALGRVESEDRGADGNEDAVQ